MRAELGRGILEAMSQSKKPHSLMASEIYRSGSLAATAFAVKVTQTESYSRLRLQLTDGRQFFVLTAEKAVAMGTAVRAWGLGVLARQPERDSDDPVERASRLFAAIHGADDSQAAAFGRLYSRLRAEVGVEAPEEEIYRIFLAAWEAGRALMAAAESVQKR